MKGAKPITVVLVGAITVVTLGESLPHREPAQGLSVERKLPDAVLPIHTSTDEPVRVPVSSFTATNVSTIASTSAVYQVLRGGPRRIV